ncbi:MAG TPA: hypothetical protein VEI57_16075 [Nitrospirota bacterium]|nr:hypothetical protein [Nitrospirota bacterium]
MFQRTSYALLILTALVLLTAMGGTGGFERAPRVEKNFSVTVTDAMGSKIDGEQFSWEGRLHLEGYRGLAQVTIPFEKLKELTVGQKVERKVTVTAIFWDGTESSFDVDAKSRCFGEASFGSFMLQMDEIKAVAFKK